MSNGPGLDAGEVRRQAQEAIDRAQKEVGEAQQPPVENPRDDDGLVSGSVEVVVSPPVTAALRARLEDSLRGMAGVRLVTSGGSGGQIRMIVFAGQPVPLAARLGQLPFVAEIATRRVKRVIQLQVRLAAPG